MSRVLLDRVAISRSLGRIVHQIIERNESLGMLGIVGIRRRGVDLARRIAKRISELEGVSPPVGTVDITLYRDDFRELVDLPFAKGSEIQFDVTGRDVVLVDDVLYTGRTVRAAIDVILDFGRPRSIQLAVLIDRGGRELPICPDYVGRRIDVRSDEYIEVRTVETDGEDAVVLVKRA